jgi:hypothetical protein
MSAITFQGQYPNIYTYPTFYVSYPPASYFNVYPFVSTGGFLRGANLIVSGGSAVRLTTVQLQQFANAIRMHLTTGSTNTTINGVQVVTSGSGVNITVSGNTILIPNDDAADLATRVLRYTVTGAPPQVTGAGPINFFDPSA